jgi:hypothetical protein
MSKRYYIFFKDKIVKTTDLPDDALKIEYVCDDHHIEIYSDCGVMEYKLTNRDQLADHLIMLERRQWMNKSDRERLRKVKTSLEPIGSVSGRSLAEHIDPPHYQGFIKDMQWIEAKQYTIPDFASAVQMQVEKYIDRNGGKDHTVQELLKARWYLDFWIAYEANNRNPIKVADVPAIIEKVKSS